MLSNQRMYVRYCTHDHGFSLIEILIALAIFSMIIVVVFQMQFKHSQVITEDYLKEIALTLLHNAYEESQYMKENWLIEEAVEKLPQGEGKINTNPTILWMEVSWFNRFSSQRNQLSFNIECPVE